MPTSPLSHDSPSPTLAQIQQTVDDWMSQWEDGYWPPLANLARLTEEVGELARELNHAHGPKRKKPSESDAETSARLAAGGPIAEELGDILFVVVALANSLEIDLSQALAAVMQKYDVRDAERWVRKPVR